MTDATGQPVANPEVEIAELRTQVSGIKNDVAQIQGAITSLIAKIDAKSQTPWGIIFAAASVLVTIVAGYTTLQTAPLNAAVVELRNSLKEQRADYAPVGVVSDVTKIATLLEKVNERFVPSDEMQRYNREVEKALDSKVDRNAFDQRSLRVDTEVVALQDHVKELRLLKADKSEVDRRFSEISDRIISQGNRIADNLKYLQEFISKFTVIPAFPKYKDQ